VVAPVLAARALHRAARATNRIAVQRLLRDARALPAHFGIGIHFTAPVEHGGLLIHSPAVATATTSAAWIDDLRARCEVGRQLIPVGAAAAIADSDGRAIVVVRGRLLHHGGLSASVGDHHAYGAVLLGECGVHAK